MATKELHPAVVDVLQYFDYEHLPKHLQAVSEPVHDLAHEMAARLEGPQLTNDLNRLLEAKDCFVRAAHAAGVWVHTASFEHSGACESVEHPQGLSPHDE